MGLGRDPIERLARTFFAALASAHTIVLPKA